VPLNTVAFWPDSKVRVPAKLKPPSTLRAKAFPLFLKNGNS
jgi:hypothetical protein